MTPPRELGLLFLALHLETRDGLRRAAHAGRCVLVYARTFPWRTLISLRSAASLGLVRQRGNVRPTGAHCASEALGGG